MGRLKNIIFVLILIFLFVEVLIIFPQHLEKIEADPPKKNKKTETQESAEQNMSGAHWVESRSGTRDWELFAKAAEGFQEKGTWELKEVKVQFYNSEKIELSITGKFGQIDTKTKNLKISGKVLIESVNGYTFSSEEVFYHSKERQVVSPATVTMKAPKDDQGDGLQIQGAQMTVDVDVSEMNMTGKIHALKDLKSGKKIDLISDSAQVSGRTHETKFVGNVIIHYGTLKIEGPEASFIYRKDKNTLKSIVLSGGVRASDEDKYAVSDEMNLDLEQNKFTFDGRPRVYQNNDELSGEQIIFLDGGKKVKVENIRGKVDPKDKIKKDGAK